MFGLIKRHTGKRVRKPIDPGPGASVPDLDLPDSDDGQPVTDTDSWINVRAVKSTSGHEPVTTAVAELALRVYHDHNDDPRYHAVYQLAYRGKLTMAEADIEILALAVMDEGAKGERNE